MVIFQTETIEIRAGTTIEIKVEMTIEIKVEMKDGLMPETTIGVKAETIDFKEEMTGFKAATIAFIKPTENLPPEETINFKTKKGLV